MLNRGNISIEISKQISNLPWQHVFVSDKPAESCLISNKTKEGNYSFPLYLYTDSPQRSLDYIKPISNLDKNIIKLLFSNINKYKWVDNNQDKKVDDNYINPSSVFDYIYAILNSPTYRERYKHFLKSDFPRVPKPKDKNSFWELVKLGGRLRQLHLLEATELSNFNTTYPIIGENIIEIVEYREGKVFINNSQYFGNVLKGTWEFYIGGYRPAQKWLKDRKGKKLFYEDIIHYQKIITALAKTIEIQKQIDQVK